ncbi:MAG: histidine phosphatase family protein [Micrococcales bacterium]|nr:histidine phosphatase family protein [Micrococcales bacterium]
MRLLLIRHGQTHSNVIHALDTAEPGADLTELGRRQAAAIPAALADEPIEALYVSNLVRTQQTAAPLAQARGLEPVVRPGIREVVAGDLEMATDRPSLERYIETSFRWADDPSARIPGGENGIEVLERYDSVVAEAAATGAECVVMVSHGAVIRSYAAARARNVDPQFAAEHWLRNTALVVLEGSPESGWECTRWEEWPLGGRELSDPEPTHTGPAGEPEGLDS